MKKLIFIALALSLSSCFSGFDETIEYRIDPRVEYYVEQFYVEGEDRGLVFDRYNLIVIVQRHNTGRFVYKQDPKIQLDGLSITQGTQRVVFIDLEIVEQGLIDEEGSEGPANKLEIVIFHELGHALLNRKHNNDSRSIMSDRFEPLLMTRGWRTEVLDELFYGK